MMRKRCYIAEWVVCMLLLTTCFSACCSIDDDLSDCPPEPNPPTPPTEQDYKLNYELRLVTNMTTELETQLTTITEVKVADALREVGFDDALVYADLHRYALPFDPSKSPTA